LDYRIYYDQGSGVNIVLATGVTQTSFTATSLTSGTTYKFYVQSRNIVGYSSDSSIVTILCATTPNVPTNLANNSTLTTQT